MNHTPGKLYRRHSPYGIYTPKDDLILYSLGSNSAANISRTIAAWNACEEAGISTEALEAGVILEMVNACRLVLEWMDRPIHSQDQISNDFDEVHTAMANVLMKVHGE